MASGLECSFECAASTYINEAKTHCVSCTKLSSDGKSCVASCVAGFTLLDLIIIKFK